MAHKASVLSYFSGDMSDLYELKVIKMAHSCKPLAVVASNAARKTSGDQNIICFPRRCFARRFFNYIKPDFDLDFV
jgi:hypothetical protein